MGMFTTLLLPCAAPFSLDGCAGVWLLAVSLLMPLLRHGHPKDSTDLPRKNTVAGRLLG